jgi:hypothetical protein
MINLLFQRERGGTMIQARPIISSPHSSENEAVNETMGPGLVS